MKKFKVLFMTLVLLVACQLIAVAESVDIRPPTILSFTNEPLEPPPDYPVNVTATISSSRPILASGVSVSYFTSSGINQTVQMAFVEGNDSLAVYFATLPAYGEGTQVTYKISAVDTSGFSGESAPASYTVKPDLTPPFFRSLGHVPYPNPNVPLTNQTEMQIVARIWDFGSGVRNATVRYSHSPWPNVPVWDSAEMHLSEGDRYDGNWTAVLPAMTNGTVIYQPEACDFWGKRGFGERLSYEIYNPPTPTAQIEIHLENLDFISKLMTVKIICSVTYASPIDTFYLEVEQGNGYGQYSINRTSLFVPRSSGIFYIGQKEWRTSMVGAVNFYPFDSYILDFRMSLRVSPLDASNTSVGFAFYGPLGLIFNSTLTPKPPEATPYGPIMYFEALITRKPNLTSQAIASTHVVYATFLVLGSTALLPFRKDDVVNRVRILVGIFTFTGILYFTIAKALQDAGITEIIGLALPQALLLGLMWAIGVFLVGSLLGLLLEESGRLQRHRLLKVHLLSLGLSAIALIVIAILCQTSVLGRPRSFFEIDEVRNWIIFGLFYAAVGTSLVDIWRYRVQITDKIRRIDRNKGLDDFLDEYET